MRNRNVQNKKTERGQAFMELAVSLVFLLILFTVMVDLGWAFYTLIAMRDTVQEAAAYGSMCPVDPNLIEDRLRRSASAPIDINRVDASDIDIDIVDPSGVVLTGQPGAVVRGNSVQITLRYEHQIVVPFVATFIGRSTYPLHVTVADTILKENNTDCQ